MGKQECEIRILAEHNAEILKQNGYLKEDVKRIIEEEMLKTKE